MPKPLVFAPAHKAIIDKADNSLSLVGIIHGLVVNPLPDQGELPPNAVMPLNWSMGMAWLRSEDDKDKTFEERVDIVMPNNNRVTTSTLPFQMTHRTHHSTMITNLFPIGTEGEYRLILMLRELPEGEWKEVAEYPLEIKFAQQQEAQEAGE